MNRRSAIGLIDRFTIRPHYTSDGHRCSAKNLSQVNTEIPFSAWNTAEKVQAERPELRKGMTRKMGLSEQTQTSDAPSLRKLMPLYLAYRPKVEVDNDPLEQDPQQRQVGEGCGRATMSFNDPLDSVHA